MHRRAHAARWTRRALRSDHHPDPGKVPRAVSAAAGACRAGGAGGRPQRILSRQRIQLLRPVGATANGRSGSICGCGPPCGTRSAARPCASLHRHVLRRKRRQRRSGGSCVPARKRRSSGSRGSARPGWRLSRRSGAARCILQSARSRSLRGAGAISTSRRAGGARPYDLAALAAYYMGLYATALSYGREALAREPENGRLRKNLEFYEAAAAAGRRGRKGQALLFGHFHKNDRKS